VGIIGIQLGFLLMASLLLWRALDRLRLIRRLEDTPTAKIASAPQGFVQLGGLTQAGEGPSLRVPYVQVPCVWYRYVLHEEAAGNEEDEPLSVQQTTQRFRIADRTGECTVDPNGAEVEAGKTRRWSADGMTHEVRWIGVGEHLTVIGWLATLHPRPRVADVMPGQGGERRRYGQLQAEEHLIRRPPDGRLPFFIGASHELRLVKRLRWQLSGWLIAAFIVGVVFPLAIAVHNA